MIITIDGPSVSGKSSLARNIARELNIYYLNTGLIYRAVAYILVSNFNYSEQDLANAKYEDITKILNQDKFNYIYLNNDSHVIYNNIDITEFLHSSQVSKYASILSSNLKTREILQDYQKNFGVNKDLVCDGRDCGSILFPNADLKFFLTASIDVRAKRWQRYLADQGQNLSLEECKKKVTERDNRDKKVVASLSVVPKDAIVIDNSNLTQEETVKAALEKIKP